MNQFRRFRKNKDVTIKRIKKVKSTTLKLALIMLNFIFATFAWFTYTMILNPAVDVHVSAWQIDFKDDATTLGSAMQFEVSNFYPGMNDYTKSLEIVNLGDRPASIDYEISKIQILGQEYQIKETVEAGDSEYTLYKSIEEVYKTDAGGNTVVDGEGNPIIEKYIIKLLNDSAKYPFELILTYSAEIGIAHPDYPEQNKGEFEICFTWPYEITTLPAVLPDDLEEGLTDEQKLEELNLRKTALDTQWGYDIANFYEAQGENPTEEVIEITLKVIAKQII